MLISIDFGTSNSSAALILNNTIKMVKDPLNNSYLFSSTVYLTELGQVLVGEAAESNRLQDIRRYRRNFKLALGDNTIYLRDPVNNHSFTPHELVTEVLKRLKVEAENMATSVGHREITEAIITIPAIYRNQINKHSLIEQAAKAAGFTSVQLLEEPVAAAIYYAYHQKHTFNEGEIILVYDLGGGTFDATLMKKQGAGYQILATSIGLTDCSGSEFDRVIFQHCLETSFNQAISQQLQRAEAWRDKTIIHESCIRIKHQLSEAQEASEYIQIGQGQFYKLTRATFNSMISPYIQKTIESCDQLIKNAGIEWQQVNQILMVGGSCYIPYVKEILQQKFGRSPLLVDEPKLAVCQGAAIYGAGLDKISQPIISQPRQSEPHNYLNNVNNVNNLKLIRRELNNLGNAVNQLVSSFPSVFQDSTIASQLATFQTALTEAQERLNKPSFCIATIGTTSSGKSTIVNALIGRRIAPIEAGEMSGGVLTIKHSEERQLIIEPTEGAAWQTGEFTGLNDEAIYNKLREQMLRYHEVRRHKDLIAPQVTAAVPLLPVGDPNLLGLPQEVGIEFIDLPGLKSVKDGANLKVIQSRVQQKIFSLVALDYNQVDDEHRGNLLKELKEVVSYLKGTDSIIFILNRVDQRGADDLPLSERIKKLKEEIQQVLSLPELPDILPFKARLLYYAQRAWGTTSLNQNSLVDQQTRLESLKNIFKDCQGIISKETENNRNLRNWFRNLEDDVLDGKNISDETTRQVLQYALEWSGGRELWSLLRKRVQESFAKLVILPALIEFFPSYDALSNAIDTVVSTRKINTEEEVYIARARIENSRESLQREIDKNRENFRERVKDDIEDLKQNTPESQSRVEQRAEKDGLKGFNALTRAINDIDSDLTRNLIAPVRNALQNNSLVRELREELEKVITPALAKDVTEAYDAVTKKLTGFTLDGDELVKSVKEDDTRAKEELDAAEKSVRQLYQAIGEALTARAEYILQAQAEKLKEGLQSLVDKETKDLFITCKKELPTLNLDEAIMAEFKKSLSQNPPKLPERFFEISAELKQEQIKRNEIVGTKTEYYTKGFWFWKKTKSRTVDVRGDVRYSTLKLPTTKTMAHEWISGIAKEKESLWDNLSSWIINQLNQMNNSFNKSVNDVLNLAERSLQQQLSIIKQNSESEMQLLRKLQSHKPLADESRQKLEIEARTSLDA